MAISSRNTQLADRACGSGGRRCRRRRWGDSRDSTSAVASSWSGGTGLGGAVTAFSVSLATGRRTDWQASCGTGIARLGYGSGIWWPFQICAALVSYTGFALSAWVVARLHRGNPAMLLAYVASVVTALAVECGSPRSADSPLRPRPRPPYALLYRVGHSALSLAIRLSPGAAGHGGLWSRGWSRQPAA